MPQIASLTEYSATNAWNLNLNNGNVNNNTKASNTNRVRAVSALLTEIETKYYRYGNNSRTYGSVLRLQKEQA